MAGRDNQLYVHDVFLADEIKNRSLVANKGVHQNDAGHLRGSNLYKPILQDIYAVDNCTVSKVVDETGEPLTAEQKAKLHAMSRKNHPDLYEKKEMDSQKTLGETLKSLAGRDLENRIEGVTAQINRRQPDKIRSG